jgi:hypothetical protein
MGTDAGTTRIADGPDAGQGATTPEPAIDLTTEADRAMTRRLMARYPSRWRGITPEVKDKMVSGLVQAADVARDAMNAGGEAAIDGANVMLSAVRTTVAIEAQIQADDHLADKHARIDAGLSTEVTEHKLYSVEATDLIEGV